MQATLAANAIRYTITGSAAAGALAGTPGTEVQIINEALQALARRHPWRWLTRVTQPLSLIANQPWVELPRDFDELIAIVRGPGLLTWMEPMTDQELLEFRAGTVPTGDPFGHYYLVEHAEQFNPNFLLDTEAFSTANWTVTNGVTTGAGGVSPEGVNDATTLNQAANAAGSIAQELSFSAVAENGRTYIASLFVKAGTAAFTDISLLQAGASGEVTSASPLTTLRITWTAGVPSVARQSSQGAGAHDVGVESRGDGWYRVWCLMSVDLDKALPSSSIFYVVRPAITVGGTVIVWGAQLEQHSGHHVDSTQMRPTRYRPDSDQPAVTLRRQLTIWPTPATTQPNSFLMRYRAQPPTVGSESDTIVVPWFLETLVLEACRHIARGWHSEDMGGVTERLAGLWATPDFIHAQQRDDDAQRELGPMRGTAASSLGVGMAGRNWNQGSVAYPGALS